MSLVAKGRVAALASWVSSNAFILGMVAMVLLASLWPDLGKSGGWLHSEWLCDLGIALIFFLHGLSLSTEKLKAGFGNWRLHLLIQGSTFLIFPLLWVMSAPFLASHLPTGLVMGFIYLCALPSTISSSVAMTAAGRGNVVAAIFNATLSSLLGVFLTPLLIAVLAQSSGEGISLLDTVLKIARMLLLPMLCGQLLRPWLWRFAAPHKAVLGKLDRGVILLLVLAAFSDSVAAGLWHQYGFSLLGVTLLGAGGFLLVILGLTSLLARVCGLNHEDRVALVFCGSKKTLASGVPMAKLLFGASPWLGMIVLPIMFYHQLQLLICAVLASRYARHASSQ